MKPPHPGGFFHFTTQGTNHVRAISGRYAFVRLWEGGWSNDRLDPGGLTKWGVTIRTVIAKALDFNGDGKVNEADLRAMTEAQAEALYRADYYDKLRCDDLPDALALLVFDCAVNQGPGRAAKFLQSAVNAKADGVVGAKTVAATRLAYGRDGRAVLREFQTRRALHYSALSTFARFGRGQFRRLIDGTIEAAQVETVEPPAADTSAISDFLADIAANAEAAASMADKIARAAQVLAGEAKTIRGVGDDIAADLRDRAFDLQSGAAI